MRQFFDTEFLENQVFGEDATGEEGMESLPVEIMLTLEDGRDLTCRVAGVFMEQEKEYIALEADEKRDDSEGMIYVMGLSQGEEDGIELRPLVDKEEQERALAAFFRMVEEEDYAAQAVFDGRLEEAEDRMKIESEIEDDRN